MNPQEKLSQSGEFYLKTTILCVMLNHTEIDPTKE